MISTIRQLEVKRKPDGAFFVRLLFLVGTILGCAVGFYFCGETECGELDAYVAANYKHDSFYNALFQSCKYVLILFLFGTSYAGVLLIPALSLVYAYDVSSCVSAEIFAWGTEILAPLIVYYAVPALVAFFCFFVIADTMIGFSKKLCYFWFYDTVTGGSDKPLIKIAVCLFLLLLVGLYRYFTVPGLLEILS